MEKGWKGVVSLADFGIIESLLNFSKNLFKDANIV